MGYVLPEGAQRANLTNKRITNAFMVVAGVGGAFAIGAELSKLALEIADMSRDTLGEGYKLFMNHGKGAAQAIVYTGITNLVASSLGNNAGFKERDYEKATMQDRSLLVGALCLLGNLAWEGFSALSRDGKLDIPDLATVTAGVAMLVMANKFLESSIKTNIARTFQAEPSEPKIPPYSVPGGL